MTVLRAWTNSVEWELDTIHRRLEWHDFVQRRGDGNFAWRIARGGHNLVMGPSGAGKTKLALRFIAQGLSQGERCLYVPFRKAEDQLAIKADSRPRFSGTKSCSVGAALR